MEFCEKLVYIMEELNIKSAELARKVPVDPALVSRWRTGARVPRDDDTISSIAVFVADSARTDREKSLIDSLVSGYEDEGLNAAEKIALWFFDGRSIQAAPAAPQSQPAGLCFPGADGFLAAVSMLEHAMSQRVSGTELTVYVSTEHMNLILDKRIGSVWDRLYGLNKNPVPVVLEQSLDSERLSMILSALLPYIQSGRLLLYYVPSTHRQFCYSLTVLAKGAGMVIAMEPPGVRDASVSMFVDLPSFVNGVGAKLSEISESAKPMLRLLRDSGDERSFLKKCFEGNQSVLTKFGTVNLLYADPDGYKALLMANKVPYESRRWRIAEFSAAREAFEGFLKTGHYRELVSYIALDRLAVESPNTVPDLRFIEKETVVFPDAFVENLILGMINYLKRFPLLEITLTRANRGADVTRIKEDSLLLLQNIAEGAAISLGSENWLVINEYSKDFEAGWNSGDDIFGKSNVIYALTRLLNK